MEIVKSSIAKVSSNPIGAVVGLGGGYLIAKKMGVSSMLSIIAISAVSAVVGSFVNSKIKAFSSQPKKSNIQ